MSHETITTTKKGESVESTVSHVLGCPQCYEAIIKKAKETFNYECSSCGLPLPDEMITIPPVENTPACPNCGSTSASEIKREEPEETEEQEETTEKED